MQMRAVFLFVFVRWRRVGIMYLKCTCRAVALALMLSHALC